MGLNLDTKMIEKLEQMRKGTLRKLYAIYIAEFILAYGMIILMSRYDNGLNNAGWIFLLSILMFTLTYQFINPIIIKRYRELYKKLLIPVLMSEIAEEISYEPDTGIDSNKIDKLGLYNMKTHDSEDFIKGKIQGINFECADLCINSIGKNNTPQFKGQWYILDFNKQFEGITHIIEKREFGTALEGNASGFYRPYGNLYDRKFKKFKTANPNFNKRFTIYTDDKQYALYILTPHFLEKIMNIEHKNNGRIFVSFYENQVHIGIHNGEDSLEPPIIEEIDKASFKHHQKELNIVNELIKEMKLHIKLFFE